MQHQHIAVEAEIQSSASRAKVSFGDMLGSKVVEKPPGSSTQIEVESVTPARQAVEFLRALDQAGRHNLVAIDPMTGETEGRTFPPGTWSDVERWIASRDGKKNLYFSANEPTADAPHKKLSKADIGAIRAVYVDIDPDDSDEPLNKKRDRLFQQIKLLRDGALPPTFTIDSGGGVQAFWRLRSKVGVEQRATAEAIGQALGRNLGGDFTHNVDRIMRLPGTLNIPTPKKRQKGRIEQRARLLSSATTTYSLDDIAHFYPPLEDGTAEAPFDRGNEIGAAIRDVDLSLIQDASDYTKLPSQLREKFQAAARIKPDLADLWQTGKHSGKDPSASAARFALASSLQHAGGFDINEFGQLLWVWRYAVSPGDDPEVKLNEREIARCWVRSEREERPALRPEDIFDVLDDEVSSIFRTPKNTAAPLELVSFCDAASSALEDGVRPLVKGLLDRGAFSVLYGESNVGKTFVAMDLAFSISAGERWCDRKVFQTGVLYVAAEGGKGAKRRAQALQRKYGAEVSQSARFNFVLASVNLRQAAEDLPRLIEAARSAGDVGLIVIDTLSRVLAGGEENSSVDMGSLVRNIDALRQATGAHVLVVHHSGKNQVKGARGHSLLRAATDTEIEIAANEITVTKQRDHDGSFRQSFVLRPVTLGTDADGDAITSCSVDFVLKSEVPPSPMTATEREIFEVLSSMHAASPNKTGFKVAEIAGAIGTETKGDTFRTHLRSLLDKGHVVRPNNGIWALKAVEKPSTAFFPQPSAGIAETTNNLGSGREAVDGILS